MISPRFIPKSVFYTQSVVRLSAVHVLYWPRSPQEDWMNFSRIALNMFLSGLNNYVKLNKYSYDWIEWIFPWLDWMNILLIEEIFPWLD